MTICTAYISNPPLVMLIRKYCLILAQQVQQTNLIHSQAAGREMKLLSVTFI